MLVDVAAQHGEAPWVSPRQVVGVEHALFEAFELKDCAACASSLRDAGMPRVVRAGQAALARLRAEGRDPSHAGTVGERRSRAASQRHAEARAWSRTRAQIAEDRQTFLASILPRVQALEVAQLARLTGLSKAQCSLARSGQRTLHPRHWAAVLGG